MARGTANNLSDKWCAMPARRIYVATKVPPKNQLWPAQPGIGIEQVFPYDYILRSTERSLKHLGMETIDLLQLHVWNPEWIARDEWRRALEELKRSGKVRAVGISINDHQPDSALEIIETGLIDTVQVIYNIFDQSPERKSVSAGDRAQYRSDCARAARRRQPDRQDRREYAVRARAISAWATSAETARSRCGNTWRACCGISAWMPAACRRSRCASACRTQRYPR